MFQDLCGDKSLSNVVIVTNMWGEVTREVGQARELQLRTDPTLFKPIFDKGARMHRHYNTVDSAENILVSFLDDQPTTLQIQREIVEESRTINQTAAGLQIEAERTAQREEQRRQQEEQIRRANEAAAARLEQQRRDQEAARIAQEALARQEEARQAAARQAEAARLAELRRQEEIRLAEVRRIQEQEAAARRRQEEEAARLRAQMEENERRNREEQQRLQRLLAEQEAAAAASRKSDWVRNRNKVTRRLKKIF